MSKRARRRPRVLAVTLVAFVGSMLAPSSRVMAADSSIPRALTLGERGSGPPMSIPHLGRGARAAAVRWSDVPAGSWARGAIDHVGGTFDWMRDYPERDGSFRFRPDRLESRKLFARTVVRAFAPDAEVDPSIRFDDLASDSPFYHFANVAVQKRWMRPTNRGRSFSPARAVSTGNVHRALVLAIGLKRAAAGLDDIHTRDGHRFDTPRNFGTLLIGMRLGLRYNHSDESLDVGPGTPLSRSEVAWSLYRATTLDEWEISEMRRYEDIRLPSMTRGKLALVQWGIRYVGFPYVWGGEWHTRSRAGYPFGSQPVGGFDCSGLAWWTLKSSGGGWDNEPPRPYGGWSLRQRTSADMATVGHVRYGALSVGDLMFYDGDRDGRVDHVDTYVGNGWSLDSGSSNAGVTITFTGEGSWYDDHFVHGRTIMGR